MKNSFKRLANEGHLIVGIESNTSAIEQFFNESNLSYKITNSVDGLKIFHVLIKFIFSKYYLVITYK